MDTNNPYAVSEASIEGAGAHTAPSTTIPFHGVTTRKLSILMVATVGIYSLVWFYRNWVRLRDLAAQDVWPIPRSIFGAFTFFRLRNHSQEWFTISDLIVPSKLANAPVIYLVCAFLSGRGGRAVEDFPVLELALIVFPLMGQIAAMNTAQDAINQLIDGAADGAPPDDDLGGAAIAAIALGALFWALILFGTFASV